MGRRAERIHDALRQSGHGALKLRAELLTAATFVVGWAGVTWGVAALTVWQVWPLSAGLLFLSLGGLRLFATVAWHGLYRLTRGARGQRG